MKKFAPFISLTLTVSASIAGTLLIVGGELEAGFLALILSSVEGIYYENKYGKNNE